MIKGIKGTHYFIEQHCCPEDAKYIFTKLCAHPSTDGVILVQTKTNNL